tara:strand:+ start:247 stop:1032 length:786 start_codon:yes stop_codon:yes gene_type:complete
MRNFTVAIFKLLLGFAAGAALTFLTFESTMRSIELNRLERLHAIENVSDRLPQAAQQSLRTSRQSAVQVMSASDSSPVISSSSGTYIQVENKYYILTVGHAIIGPCDMMRIMVEDEMYACIKYASVDYQRDYAIVEIEEIPNRRAVQIPDSLPAPSRWSHHLAIQTGVYYTGFPNGLGPLSMTGRIVGFDDSENVYIQSFAWPGSSGSGVFNEDGVFVGFVMAISVGATEYGVSVLEDLAIVVPLYQIDWSTIEEEGEEKQ